jgi:hypothetical protein
MILDESLAVVDVEKVARHRLSLKRGERTRPSELGPRPKPLHGSLTVLGDPAIRRDSRNAAFLPRREE